MLKEGDFIEIDYTGRLKDDGFVFDTTVEKTAKEQGMEGHRYGPVVVCIGQGNVLPGLEKKLVGKEPGKTYLIDLRPEEAFGKKDAKLIQLINTAKFKKDKIEPVPGMQVNVDGNMGIVRTVAGGRTMVDFNHPLSSREIVYEVSIKRLVTDDLEKASNYLKHFIGDVELSLNEGRLSVTIPQKMPQELAKMLGEKVKAVIPAIKEVNFMEKSTAPADITQSAGLNSS